MLNGATWAPLVILGVIRNRASLAGLALGMSFLSGHHQAPLFLACLGGAVLLYRGASKQISWPAKSSASIITSALPVLRPRMRWKR